jgi:hypothetical protein
MEKSLERLIILGLQDFPTEETRDSVAAKLKRGTFPGTFLIAAQVAIGVETVKI